MNQFHKLYTKLLLEVRPFTAFQEAPTLADAAKQALAIFRRNGVTNAATFGLWDYIWRNLPENLKTPQAIAFKKQFTTVKIREFITGFVKKHSKYIDKNALIDALTDEEKILQYINRPDIGSRAKGMANEYKMSQAQQRKIHADAYPVIQKLTSKRSSSNIKRAKRGLPTQTGTIYPPIEDSIIHSTLNEEELAKLIEWIKLRDLASSINIEKFLKRHDAYMRQNPPKDLDQANPPKNLGLKRR